MKPLHNNLTSLKCLPMVELLTCVVKHDAYKHQPGLNITSTARSSEDHCLYIHHITCYWVGYNGSRKMRPRRSCLIGTGLAIRKLPVQAPRPPSFHCWMTFNCSRWRSIVKKMSTLKGLNECDADQTVMARRSMDIS